MIQNLTSKIQNLQQHSGFMKYFKNTSWLFGEKILRMVVGLFVGIWVARYLGPEQFGLFSYAQSFVGLFTAIATLGLDGIVVRELVKDESRRDELIGTAFYLKLIGAIAVLIVLAVAIQFTSNDHYTNILVFIIASATIFQAFNVVDMYFQAKVLSKYVVYANVISLFVSSIVKVVLILTDAPLIAFAWATLFDSIVLALGFIYFYIKNNSTFNIKNLIFKRETAVSLLKESWPLIFTGIVISLNMRIDQVLLGNMTSQEIVGNYSAAFRISEIWYILPAVIGTSIFPAIINAKNTNEVVYIKRIIQTIKYMSIFVIPIALIVTLISDQIALLLYGESFSLVGPYLAISIWIGVPYLIFFITNQLMYTENLILISFYVSIFTVFCNITLNLLWIPLYSGYGALFATLVATYLSTLLSIIILNNKTKFITKGIKK